MSLPLPLGQGMDYIFNQTLYITQEHDVLEHRIKDKKIHIIDNGGHLNLLLEKEFVL